MDRIQAPNMVDGAPILATLDAFEDAQAAKKSTKGITRVEEIREGVGDESDRPTLVDEVVVVLGDWPFGATDAEIKNSTGPLKQTLRLGAFALPYALELAITTMGKGEHAKFKIDNTVGSCDARSEVITKALDNDEQTRSQSLQEPMKALWDRWYKTMHDNGFVEVEIQLCRYKSPKDVHGDAGLLKYITKIGEGAKVKNCVVETRLRCTTANGVCFFDEHDPPCSVDLGAESVASTTFLLKLRGVCGAVGEVLEETIRAVLSSMRNGEVCQCVVQPIYSFSGNGVPELNIAPDTIVLIDAEIISVQSEVAPAEESPETRIKLATDAKDQGNALFKKSEFNDAAAWYSQIFSILDQDYLFVPAIKESSRAIKMAASLNISMCQLKMGQYNDVIGITSELVKQDPECVKAHFRMGKAHQALGEYGAAITCYENALKYDPKLSSAIFAINETKKARKDQETIDKEKFKKMFQ
eukprot:m.196586 g.196586  ORF g.196586 m.196586 type:complete len:470 (-) comp32625_c0_seq1:51-1460(-)